MQIFACTVTHTKHTGYITSGGPTAQAHRRTQTRKCVSERKRVEYIYMDVKVIEYIDKWFFMRQYTYTELVRVILNNSYFTWGVQRGTLCVYAHIHTLLYK